MKEILIPIVLISIISTIALILFKSFTKRTISEETKLKIIKESLKMINEENLTDKSNQQYNLSILHYLQTKDADFLEHMTQLTGLSPIGDLKNNVVGSIFRKIVERIKTEQYGSSGLQALIALNAFPEKLFDNPIIETFFLIGKVNSLKYKIGGPCYLGLFPSFSFVKNCNETLDYFLKSIKEKFTFDLEFGSDGIIFPDYFFMIFNEKKKFKTEELLLPENCKISIDHLRYKIKYLFVEENDNFKLKKLKDLSINERATVCLILFTI